MHKVMVFIDFENLKCFGHTNMRYKKARHRLFHGIKIGKGGVSPDQYLGRFPV